MKLYGIMLDCGCCEAEMAFESDEQALAAVKAAGLSNGATITDAKGEVHTGLDTFYGIWAVADRQ